jgi:monoamine oxidase
LSRFYAHVNEEHPGIDEKSRRIFRTVDQIRGQCCETLTNVSSISRREFLMTTTSLVGGALAAACAAGPPAQPPHRSRPAQPPQSTQSVDATQPAESTLPVDPKSILVVGAGMAGLAAARSLTDAGRPVLVIEARDRIGGRVHTARDWGTPLEMGASWVHGTTGNPLVELAQQLQLQLIPTDYYTSTKLAVDPRLPPLNYNMKAWRRFVDRASDRVDGGSLGAAVDAAASSQELSDSDRAQLAFYLTTEIADEYAADPDQLSATTFDEGEYTGGDQAVIPSGYDAVPKLLADGLQIVLSTPVTAVQRTENSVIVRTGNRSFEGPAAIVTVPLGVLKSGAIIFDPPLPDAHIRAVNSLGFGVLSKSFFRFSRRTWTAENAFYQFIGSDSRRWAQWFTLPSSAGPIVLALNGGAIGRAVESSAANDLMASALPVARHLFGDDISLVDVRTSSWTADPYARGSYSFHPPGAGLDDRRRLQEPIGDRLYLAGEAVGTNNPATVHGALLSGRYAAAELMKRLGR